MKLNIPTLTGYSKNPLYRVWRNMMERCYDCNRDSYISYGHRGITVSPEWHHLAEFLNWVNTSNYMAGMQLDRIDNNGNYESSNCRWVTPKDNARNRRNNSVISAFGEVKTAIEWSSDARCLVDYATLTSRVRQGWDSERSLTEASRKYLADPNIKTQSSKCLLTAFGETKSIDEWVQDGRCLASKALLTRRHSRGWGGEDSLTRECNRNIRHRQQRD